LGGVKTEIFFGKSEIRLDSPVRKPPDGQITTRRREQIPLVSRTRCSALRAAPQSRDLYRRCEMDPGSAAHRCALRCVRGTLRAPLEVCQTCLMKEMRRDHIPLVSRTRCSALRAAPQSRDLYRRCEMDPGSAAHHAAKSGALRSIRGTAAYPARSRVSRTRRSVLHAAPQSRDPFRRQARWTPDQQRTTPRRAARCAASGERRRTQHGPACPGRGAAPFALLR
jgi:hypothetical protein